MNWVKLFFKENFFLNLPQNPNPETSFPSLLGQLSSLALIHPIFVMPRSSAGKEPSLRSSISLLTQSLPCELHLLNLRTLQNSDDNPEVWLSISELCHLHVVVLWVSFSELCHFYVLFYGFTSQNFVMCMLLFYGLPV